MRRELRLTGLGALLALGCGPPRHPIDARSHRVVVPCSDVSQRVDEDYRYPAAMCQAGCPQPGAAERLEACYGVRGNGAETRAMAPGAERLMICQYGERS